jgi:hypothetical protein
MHACLAGELHLLVDAHTDFGGVRVAEKQRRRERSLAKQDAGDAVLELHAHIGVSHRRQRFRLRLWLSNRGGRFGRSDFRFGGCGLSASARASAFGGRGFGFSGGCFGGICRLFGNGDRFGRRRGLGFGRRLSGFASARALGGLRFRCVGRFSGDRFGFAGLRYWVGSLCLFASARAFGRACSRRRWLARRARLRRYDGFGRRLGNFASARARGGR